MDDSLLLGRFRRTGEILGNGHSAIIEKAFDVETGNHVALKIYSMLNRDLDVQRRRFSNQVDNLLLFRRKYFNFNSFFESIGSIDNSRHVIPSEFIENLKPRDIFIQMIDYSRNEFSELPDYDFDHKIFVVALEMGEFTLGDYITDRKKALAPILPSELQSILYEVGRILVGLAIFGLVHMDIKPHNIIRVGDSWKLIDVDGCHLTNSKISHYMSSLIYTPLYCPPEVSIGIATNDCKLRFSRTMDIWSLAVTLLDFIFDKPIFYEVYKAASCREQFLLWLSDPRISFKLSTKLLIYDADLYDLIQNCMLVKNPVKRWNIYEVYRHPFMVKDFSEIQSTPSPVHQLRNCKLLSTNSSRHLVASYLLTKTALSFERTISPTDSPRTYNISPTSKTSKIKQMTSNIYGYRSLHSRRHKLINQDISYYNEVQSNEENEGDVCIYSTGAYESFIDEYEIQHNNDSRVDLCLSDDVPQNARPNPTSRERLFPKSSPGLTTRASINLSTDEDDGQIEEKKKPSIHKLVLPIKAGIKKIWNNDRINLVDDAESPGSRCNSIFFIDSDISSPIQLAIRSFDDNTSFEIRKSKKCLLM